MKKASENAKKKVQDIIPTFSFGIEIQLSSSDDETIDYEGSIDNLLSSDEDTLFESTQVTRLLGHNNISQTTSNLLSSDEDTLFESTQVTLLLISFVVKYIVFF